MCGGKENPVNDRSRLTMASIPAYIVVYICYMLAQFNCH